jgi:anti-anti-sigma factor
MTYTTSLSVDRPRCGSTAPRLAAAAVRMRTRAGHHQYCSARSKAAIEQLQIRFAPHGDCTLVHLVGELDLATSDLTSTTLRSLLAQQEGSRLVLDLRKLTFADARGISALLSASQLAAENGGWVRLACVNNPLRRLLEIVHLTSSLPVYDTVAAAVTGDAVYPQHHGLTGN